jgi:hypothetical protein
MITSFHLYENWIQNNNNNIETFGEVKPFIQVMFLRYNT